MKKLFLALSIAVSVLSCNPEDVPPPNIFQKQIENLGVGVTRICCNLPGNECAVRGVQVNFPWEMGGPMRTFIDNDNISGYFATQNWQNDIPELVGRQEIVDKLILLNPKGIISDNKSLILVNDKYLPLTNENILFSIIISEDTGNSSRAEKPCDEFMQNPQ